MTAPPTYGASPIINKAYAAGGGTHPDTVGAATSSHAYLFTVQPSTLGRRETLIIRELSGTKMVLEYTYSDGYDRITYCKIADK